MDTWAGVEATQKHLFCMLPPPPPQVQCCFLVLGTPWASVDKVGPSPGSRLEVSTLSLRGEGSDSHGPRRPRASASNPCEVKGPTLFTFYRYGRGLKHKNLIRCCVSVQPFLAQVVAMRSCRDANNKQTTNNNNNGDNDNHNDDNDNDNDNAAAARRGCFCCCCRRCCCGCCCCCLGCCIQTVYKPLYKPLRFLECFVQTVR